MQRVSERRQRDQAGAASRAVEAAIRGLVEGEVILFVHDLSGTAHLVASAQHVRIEALARMTKMGQGVLRAAMTADRMRELHLEGGTDSPIDGRRYGPPVDLAGRDRVGSLADRVETVRALASPGTLADILVTPGHVSPVETDPSGCLAVAQLPEAAYDLARLAGPHAVGLYNDLPALGRVPRSREQRERLGQQLDLAVVSLRDLVVHLEHGSHAVRRIVTTDLPTLAGDLTAIAYRSERTGDDYIAFVHGQPNRAPVPVYVHSRCPISDVFGGLECGCGERLERAMAAIRADGAGVVIYSDPAEGEHLGHLMPPPVPTHYPGRVVRASREREIASLLRDLDIERVRLDYNEPLDIGLLEALGVQVDIDAARGALPSTGAAESP